MGILTISKNACFNKVALLCRRPFISCIFKREMRFDMKNIKLMIMALLAAIPMGCSADYSVDLGHGYSYEHWGNNFIAHTSGGETRQVIKGQVKSYLKHGDFVIVSQHEKGSSVDKYYLLSLSSGGIEVFSDIQSLIGKASQIGFNKEDLNNFGKA